MARVLFPTVEPHGGWELSLELADVRLVGGSVAALATAFAVPGWRTAVDMGRCSALLAAQETVLLTHCHSDHVAGLVAWLSAHTRRHPGASTRIVLPQGRRDALLEALLLWPDLDGVRRRVDLSAALVGISAGESVELAEGGWARAFAVDHGVPAVGWRLGAADETRPRVVFAGDGTVAPFRADPGLLEAAVAVVECSFWEPGTRVAARLAGHAHLADWLELYPDLPCDALVLSHLPPEADASRLLELIDSLPAAGPLLIPWLIAPEEAPEGGR